MKAICIHVGPWREIKSNKVYSGPQFLEDCIVEEESEKFYYVQSYLIDFESFQKKRFYKKWFIPLSNIDETTFERNINTVTETL